MAEENRNSLFVLSAERCSRRGKGRLHLHNWNNYRDDTRSKYSEERRVLCTGRQCVLLVFLEEKLFQIEIFLNHLFQTEATQTDFAEMNLCAWDGFAFFVWDSKSHSSSSARCCGDDISTIHTMTRSPCFCRELLCFYVSLAQRKKIHQRQKIRQNDYSF